MIQPGLDLVDDSLKGVSSVLAVNTNVRRRGPELTREERADILARADSGVSRSEIQRTTGHSKAAIRSTLDRASTRVNHKTVQREEVPFKPCH